LEKRRRKISINIDNLELENVSSFKYLGMMPDPMLDFGMQVDYDYAMGKAECFKYPVLAENYIDVWKDKSFQTCSLKKLVNIPVTNISILDITQNFSSSSTFGGNTVASTDPSSTDCADTFLCQAGHQSVCVYTDGSVYGKGVGCGASAAVLYHQSPSTEICYKSSAVGRMVSIEECEADGIILSINMITQYYNIHSE